MSEINYGFARAIATWILFFLSTIFVIQPLSFHVPLPIIGRTRIIIGLMTLTPPIIAILILLWAAQCIGATEIRDGVVGTDGVKPYNILILFICLAYMAITLGITGVFQALAFWVSNQGGNSCRKLYFYFYGLFTSVSRVIGNDPGILSLHAMHTILVAVGQALTNIKFYIIHAEHTLPLYSRMENGQRSIVTTFRQFTSGFSGQGHSSCKDRTSSGYPRPDDIVDVGGAWKDINWFMENISRAVQNGHNDWHFLKLIVERSDSFWDHFINMPHRASPFIRKSIEAYRLILFDVNDAIHSHSSISPNRIDEFNVRLKEFERDLVAIQFQHMRLPDNPSQHQSFHMFKDSRNLVINGGSFIQSGPSDRYDRQLAKMMYMHYLTLGVLFGLVWAAWLWQARLISSLFNGR